jgi:hypothetical protein
MIAVASATAAAALFYDLHAGGEPMGIHRELTARERNQSSTLRELLGYAHATRVLADEPGGRLRGRLVEIVGDSQAAGAIFGRGGSQRVESDSGELELFEAFLAVFESAERGGFDVAFRWVPREQLVEADALSKYIERHDFSLTTEAFARVLALGHWDVDRFAAAHNAKSSRPGAAPRFNSLFATAGSEGVNAFAQSWTGAESFVLHDFNQVDKVLDRVERDDAVATIVVPVWPWAKFWRRIQSGAWRERVEAELRLPPGSIVPNAENATYCVFGAASSGTFRSDLLVMRTRRLQPRAGANDGIAYGGTAEAPPVAARVEVDEPRAGRAGSGGGGGAVTGWPAPPPPTMEQHGGQPAAADREIGEGSDEGAANEDASDDDTSIAAAAAGAQGSAKKRRRDTRHGRSRRARIQQLKPAIAASVAPPAGIPAPPPTGAHPCPRPSAYP